MPHDSVISQRDTAKKVDSPLVTVALPVYNGSATLAVAIRSILMQTLQNWELIIVDDGSKDNSLDLARGFDDSRIRLITHEKNKSLPASLNEAVSLARGRYLARMDQDDIAFPERLALQMAFLDAHPEIDLVGSSIVVFNNAGNCQGSFPQCHVHEDICSRPWNGFHLPHPTWMGKMEWFRKNPYDPGAAKAEDQDLLLRSFQSSRFACLPEVLLGYRQDDRSFRKMFAARKAFATSCVGESLRRQQYHVLPIVYALFSVKILADFMNIHIGFKRLRNRMETVSPDVLRQWQGVWRDVHAPAIDDCGCV